MKTIEQRFEEKYIPVPESGCWIWLAQIDKDGYGKFRSPFSQYAHRHSHIQKYGKIPKGLILDHLCKVRCCVNPDHTEAVTTLENVNRGRRFNSEKTHCPKGHPYSGDNLYTCGTNRKCKACDKIRYEIKLYGFILSPELK